MCEKVQMDIRGKYCRWAESCRRVTSILLLEMPAMSDWYGLSLTRRELKLLRLLQKTFLSHHGHQFPTSRVVTVG
jgi:hypothetical protein